MATIQFEPGDFFASKSINGIGVVLRDGFSYSITGEGGCKGHTGLKLPQVPKDARHLPDLSSQRFEIALALTSVKASHSL
jgi:hypothetical protein